MDNLKAMDTTGGGGGAPMAEDARDWSEMTSDCLMNIFLRLNLEDRWKGPMLVCRSWFDASRDASLFSSFDLPTRERQIDSMLRTVVEGSSGYSYHEIRVRHCSDSSLTIVAEWCPNLEVLSIRSCRNVTDVSAFKIAAGCPMLRELDISNCHEISYKSIQVIGENCPNLVMLKRNLLNWIDPSQHVKVVPEYLRACPQDGDTEAGTIAKFMPRLKHLELRFSNLSTRGLDLISKACADLEYLDMFGCANLTSRAVKQASANLKNPRTLLKPNFYIPRSVFHTERYGHWRLQCVPSMIRCINKFHV